MAGETNGHTPSPEVLEAARRLIPERGGGIDSLTISASGMGGRSVTLTAEDSERSGRARGIGDDGVVGYSADAMEQDPDPDAVFRVPGRREFVEPKFVREGGNPDSDYAPLVDFLPAPTVAAVARLIAAKYRRKLPHLFPPFNQQVDYLWKRTGGESAARTVLGKCIKVGALAKHYANLVIPEATWVIWIAADNCALITNRQIRGLVLHELLHTGMNEKLKAKIRGHDVEEFRLVIEEFGFIFDDLRELKASVLQRSLFEDDERQEESE